VPVDRRTAWKGYFLWEVYLMTVTMTTDPGKYDPDKLNDDIITVRVMARF